MRLLLGEPSQLGEPLMTWQILVMILANVLIVLGIILVILSH